MPRSCFFCWNIVILVFPPRAFYLAIVRHTKSFRPHNRSANKVTAALNSFIFIIIWARSFNSLPLYLGSSVEQPFDWLFCQPQPSPYAQWGGHWIWQWNSMMCSSAPHSQAAEGSILYLTCVSRSGNVRHRCGGGWAGFTLFLEGSLQDDGGPRWWSTFPIGGRVSAQCPGSMARPARDSTATKLSRLDAHEYRKAVRWCRTQASSLSSQE